MNPVCNYSLYGVLPLEDTGFLQFKCEQDYLCSSEPNSGDQRDSVPFLSLIEKLIKSSEAVVCFYSLKFTCSNLIHFIK